MLCINQVKYTFSRCKAGVERLILFFFSPEEHFFNYSPETKLNESHVLRVNSIEYANGIKILSYKEISILLFAFINEISIIHINFSCLKQML